MSDEIERTPDEERALEAGWVPKEEFNGDPDNWKTAREYNMFGDHMKKVAELNKKISEVERKTEDRYKKILESQKIEHQQKIERLEAERERRLEDLDVDGVKEIDKKIKAQQKSMLQDEAKETPPASNQVDPAIDRWNKANPWANNPNSPEVKKANEIFAERVNVYGEDIETALRNVDSEINKIFPDLKTSYNPRRETGMTEDFTQKKRKVKPRELTMNDLTDAEREMYASTSSFYIRKGSKAEQEKAFLEDVKKTRLEAEKENV